MDKDNKTNNRAYALSGFLLVLASALHIYKINQGLWYDELFNLLEFLVLPWNQVLFHFPQPNNHLMYTVLAKLCMKVFGEKEWSIRLPSMILGSFIPAVYFWLLRKRSGDFSAFVTGLFLTLNYWMVWFSQDARGYTGFILFGGINQFLFLDLLERRKGSTAAFYLLTAMVSCYFHLYMTILIAGQISYGFYLWAAAQYLRKARPTESDQPATKTGKRKQKKLQKEAAPEGKATFWYFMLPVFAMVLSLLPYLPVAPQLALFFNRSSHYISGRWLGLGLLKETLQLFTGSHLMAPAVLIVLIAIPGAIKLYQSHRHLFWIYVLPVTYILLATLVLHLFIYARFLSFAMPIFCLALATGIELASDLARLRMSRVKRSYLKYALVALVCAILAAYLGRYYHLGKQGFKEASEYMPRKYPGVKVISYGISASYFRVYYPTAQALTTNQILTPEKLRGKLLIASFPDSWPANKKKVIHDTCTTEKIWRSAGSDILDVYLFRCF